MKRSKISSKLLAAILAPIIILALVFIGYYLVPLPVVEGSNIDLYTQKIATNSPLKIYFSQNMNQKSVEKNFKIAPEVKGALSWKDQKTLIFTPQENFPIDSTYYVSIEETATSSFGKKLPATYHEKFIIIGPPRVVLVTPKNQVQTEENREIPAEYPIVSLDQKITVAFDRPIRPLQTKDNEQTENLKNYLQIEPAVTEQYKWLGTSSFQFIPDHLPMGNVFTATVPQGVKTLDNGQTEEDYVWHFETPAVKIVETVPFDGDNLWVPFYEMKFKFNQPISLAEVQTHFKIYPSNDYQGSKYENNGFFNGEFYYAENDLGEKDETTVVIKPDPDLSFSRNYTVILKAGLAGKEGIKALEQDYSLEFETLTEAKVKDYSPKDQAQDVNPNNMFIRFSTPVELEEVRKHISIEPAADEISFYLSKRDTALNLEYDLKPSTEYKLILKDGLKDKIGQDVKNLPLQTFFTTKEMEPYFSTLSRGSKAVFDINYPIEFYLKTANIQDYSVRFCKIDPEKFIQTDANYNWDYFSCSNPDKWSIKLENSELNTYETHKFDLSEHVPDLSDGFYYIDFYSNQYKRDWGDYSPYHYQHGFLLTDMALVMKNTSDEALVWATDFVTGEPIADVELTFYDEDGTALGNGQTDSNGLFHLQQELPDYRLYVIGKKGQRISMTADSWSDGIRRWDFGLEGSWNGAPDSQIFAYTERPIYRPGQKVFFKGIIRQTQNGHPQLPKEKEALVIIEDANYKNIYEERLALSDNGTFQGEIQLDAATAVGQYSLRIETLSDNKGYYYRPFWVEEYRKPEYKIDITSDQAEYINHETLLATIKGSYYFGGSLTNASLIWKILKEDYYFSEHNGKWYSFSDNDSMYRCFWYCSNEQEEIASGEAELNDQGEFKLEYPLNITEEPVSQLYSLTAVITDQNEQQVAKRVTFPIHKGQYYVGIRNEGYIFNPAEQMRFNLITLDPQGTALSNKNLEVQLYLRKWNSVRKQNVDGEFYYESEIQDELVDVQKTVSNSDGLAEAVFTAPDQGGSYFVKAISKDERDNEISAAVEVYVSSRNFISWNRQNNDRIDLETDKMSYAIGETAKILVKSPFEKGGKALITYERENISHYQIVDLKGGVETIEVPIKADMLPNIFVSAVIFKGTGELGQLNRLSLEVEDTIARLDEMSRLIPKKEAEKEELKEQEETNRNKILVSKLEREIKELNDETIEKEQLVEKLKIERDDLEKSLNVKDRIVKPEFKVGYTTLFVNTDSKKLNIELTPNQERYEPGETVQMEIKVTDYQNNPVQTEISLAVIDESILAIKSLGELDLIKIFYKVRGLVVETSSNMVWFMERINLQATKGDKGGGGGELSEQKKRGEFRDTAYWNPEIKTDENGYAVIEFTLPDNLTTWQTIAIGVNQDTLVGAAKKSFMTTKKVFIRPATPRFVKNGDELFIWGIVHNETEAVKTVQANFSGNNFEQLAGGEKEITLDPHTNKKVGWKIKVLAPAENEDWILDLDYEVKDKNNEVLDAVNHQIPIQTYSVPEIVATAGITKDSALEQIQLVPNLELNLGQLEIKLAASVINGLQDSFDSLLQYPYGCSEQVMSKLLPAVSIKQLANELENSDLLNIDEEKLTAIVQQGLQKEYEYQRPDGGFGYWKESEHSYPYLSAYVLHGLWEVKQAGYSVDDKVFTNGEKYLQKVLKEKIDLNDYYNRLTLNDKTYVLWVLTKIGQPNLSFGNTLFDQKEELDLYAKAYLAMALYDFAQDNSGQLQETLFQKVQQLNSEIINQAFINERDVHFEEERESFYNMNTNFRTSAIVALNFTKTDPKNELLPKIIQWLRQNINQRGRFASTQEISWQLLALTAYLKETQELSPNYQAKSILNKKVVQEEIFDKNSTLKTLQKNIPIRDLNQAFNEVRIEKTGEGTLYYDLVLKYFLPLEEVLPRSEGFEIVRKYYDVDDKKRENALSEFKTGQTLKGHLTIIVPEDRHNVLVEEFLPAAFEPINFNLDIVDRSLKSALISENKRWGYEYYESEIWRFNHTEMRDDRIALFAEYLPAGIYEYDYLVRVTSAGTFHHLPAQVSEMYFPEHFARSEGSKIEVLLNE